MPKSKLSYNQWMNKMEKLQIQNHKMREESARFKLSKDLLDTLKSQWDEGDTLENDVFFENLQKKLKNGKKSKKKMIFVTLNFNEKLVTPTGTVPIVEKIIHHPKVTNYYAAWEWRDITSETGLHCHILLLGDTRRLIEFLKRQKGPFLKLTTNPTGAYANIKKYSDTYWSDKVRYVNGETFDSNKNIKKSNYNKLREKYELPNLYLLKD